MESEEQKRHMATDRQESKSERDGHFQMSALELQK
jgi:hypothetical protein